MSGLDQQIRDFTIAAYSCGYAIDLRNMGQDESRPWTTAFRCTWRRSGWLSAGEYREVAITEELIIRAGVDVFSAILLRQLVRPLIGDDMLTLIEQARARLVDQSRTGAAPAEFYGGPRDGDVLTVRTDRDGLPESEIVLAVSTPMPWVQADETSAKAVAFDRAVYRRGNLDTDRGVWRYDIL